MAWGHRLRDIWNDVLLPYSFLHLSTLRNDYVCRGLTLSSYPSVLNLSYDVHSICNSAKDHVLVVQKWGSYLKRAFVSDY